MPRAVLAIVGGVAVAILLVVLTEMVWHQISPLPPTLDIEDEAAMTAWLARVPVAKLAVVVLGWALGAGLGAFAAARFARRGAWPGWAVTGLLLVLLVANFVIIAYPMWFMAAGLVAIPAAGWLGTTLGARRA